MAFYPYLNFGGNAREAFTRYQEIFGGELYVMNLADLPAGEEAPEGTGAPPDMVLHATLRLDEHRLLMASDVFDPSSFGPVQGMYVNYEATDVDDAKRVWDALCDGGTIEMPAEEAFFSPFFGVCVDRFGTPWMITAPSLES